MFGAKLTTALVICAAVWPAGAYAITYPAVNPNTAAAQQELRSQDAPPSNPTASVSDGFTWADAGIGGAVILGLLTLAGATVLVTGRGRGRAPAGPSA